MNVRQATPDDFPALARLRWTFGEEGGWGDPNADYAAFEARFTRFLSEGMARGRWVFWIAEQADQVVASLFVQIIEGVPYPGKPVRNYGWIHNVYTLPEFRNQGIGSALMRRVIDWAKSQHFESLNLWHSPESVTYYERLGFVHTPDEFMMMLDEQQPG